VIHERQVRRTESRPASLFVFEVVCSTWGHAFSVKGGQDANGRCQRHNKWSQSQAQAGQTVLQAARAAGIDIPTLCSHPALKPDSICRICVVEIERQRVLQPACTFPVAEGMVIATESDKVTAARKMVLQLLFAQRLHYCMYCAESGGSEDVECELQKLAYRYQLDSWTFAPNTLKRWPVDASRSHFVMDHNRCIMCRRCVRACDEIVANHTLSIRGRGARTMIIADDDVPFGESSCVSCGTCLQVCPRALSSIAAARTWGMVQPWSELPRRA